MAGQLPLISSSCKTLQGIEKALESSRLFSLIKAKIRPAVLFRRLRPLLASAYNRYVFQRSGRLPTDLSSAIQADYPSMAPTNTISGDGSGGHLFVPGTIQLVDLEGTMRAKHASGSGKSDIVLIPAPSGDPDDPLNWSPRRKLLATSCMCVYVLMVGIASAAIYSVLVPISEATGLTLADLNAGTGYVRPLIMLEARTGWRAVQHLSFVTFQEC